ncbi:hypothetical protein [Peptostreptococcus equinus]|uniref:Uncharacterized protein n=1 Tax=Peptostreptococcus equinus TaxID=3003601 RepID=A0ABY7JM05_9FIRM|nr:hypothetical protein [Peptostreptococcus sp. CBA3647]WAW14398.1 hypothetical protein O0R46_07270 [Peptostreptococcus sp. CBA3647]
MTAKKDLKRAKSKKKANKSASKYKASTNSKTQTSSKIMSYEKAVNSNTRINIYSIFQTVMVMLVTALTFFIKPGSKHRASIISQNNLIRENILTNPILIIIGIILILSTAYMLYMAYKEKDIKKFHFTGAIMMGIGAAVCLLDNMKKYEIYSFFVLTIIAIGFLQIAKMVELRNVRSRYKNMEA